MDKDRNKNSIFGAIIIVIVVVGLLIYLIPKKVIELETSPTNNTGSEVTDDGSAPLNESDEMAEIETDLNNFDGNSDDVSFDETEF